MPKSAGHEPNKAKPLVDSRLALDGSVVPIGYVALDIDGRVLDVNPKWYEILGYARDEVRGRRFEEFVAPRSRHLFNQQFSELPIRGEVTNLELSMLRQDGSLASILFNGTVERDSKGKVQRIHSFLNDITSVPTPQQTLERSEVRFRQLFDYMSSCVAVYESRQAGEDFVLVDFNRAAERAEKISREDVLGRSVLEVFPGIRDFGLFEVFQRVWRTGNPEHHPVAQYSDQRIRGWRENYVCKLPSGELIAIYDDVTERKQAEQTLADAAREWQATFDASNDAIWLLDTENRITGCNLRAERMLTIPRTQQIGKYCWEVVHGTTGPFPECPLLDARESLDRETLVLPLGERWLEIIVDPVLDEHGQYRGAVHTIRDITEEHEAARLLRASEERLRVISRASHEDIWQLDLAGKVTYASSAVRSVFGYTPEEARQFGFDAFFPAHELPRAIEAFTKAISGVELQVLDFEGLHKDGSLVPIEVTVTPVFDGDSVTGVQGVARDITERKHSESLMLAAQRFLDSVIDQSPFAMWVSDSNGTIIRTNQSLRETLGLTDDQIVGLYNVFEDTNLEKQGVMPQVRVVFDKLEPTRFSIMWKAKDAGSADFADAHDLHLDVSMFPIVAPDGLLSNVVCQWVDVTQRVQAEELLIASERSIQRKLDAILSPDDEGVEGIKLRDLLDVESVQAMMDDFYA
ncbi:PAS domain S-box protein, partial [Candidatus Bipolaricaulota bacterium]|nr:PAS domain S-box protein [Candidatus Bipolaricaulota bacterium]